MGPGGGSFQEGTNSSQRPELPSRPGIAPSHSGLSPILEPPFACLGKKHRNIEQTLQNVWFIQLTIFVGPTPGQALCFVMTT